ncbi:conjugal transfer protein TrbL family protein [Ruminococcus bicirculans (ex Wegman et al. 2014)]|uniref:conjugal transfer protein TrbL family protein n=1 Tax=Ruminococcus bicirculans (ex Wegman et al. 2014) TaxID=1160721 RepID=UPI003FD7E8D7
MFDWISDAIDWIGDGISSLWDNTIGSAVDTITDAIWDVMFEWLFNLIYGAVADLFEFINASTSSIFALSWVQSFIALFHSLAWMLFVCGLIVAVFDTAIAYESGQANIKNTCLNVLKGFMAASLVTVVPQRLYSFCVNLQGTFSSDLLGNFISGTTTTVADSGLTVIMALAMDVSLFSLFFIILFGYCTVKVVFSNIKRGGIMLCQIAVGSLYLFGVPRGYTDGFYSWCKQVIATCLTAFLQTTILYLGLLTYTQHALLAVGICLSANEVPRIAQMYGLDTSVRVNMMSVSHTVSMGSKAVGLIKGKA